MFRETIHTGDQAEQGTATEAHALSLLRRALRRGYSVEATPAGGAVVTWTRALFGPHDGEVVRAQRSITLEPTAPAGTISPSVRKDLEVIDSLREVRMTDAGRIEGGFYGIPQAASRRLVERGLVVVHDGVVRVSLVARLAMLAQDHRTWTKPAGGYVSPSSLGRDFVGIGRGLLYDRSSAASCSCSTWSSFAEDRADARRLAAGHRQQATAQLVGALA